MIYNQQLYDEFSERMHKTYPTLYKTARGQFWGFEIGPGWWPLVDTLSKLIVKREEWLDRQRTTEIEHVTVTQIKEKFGGLRFYYNGGDDWIEGAVALTEALSHTICEECGVSGKARTEGWIKTLCDTHHEERQKRYKDIKF